MHPDAVALFEGDGRLVSMNRAAVDIFTTAAASAPQTVDDIALDGLDVARLKQTLRGDSALPHPTDLAQTIRVDDRQTGRRLLPRVLPVPALDPSRGGAILLLSDVTELARVDELRSELVAVASHELQTPLTTLRMTLLMLREDADALPSRHRELVTTALLGVEQLTEIVHEFLDLTRIEAGELRLNLEPVRMADLVRETIARNANRAAAQDVRLAASIAPDLPVVLGDAARLRSVLDNLLSNALKYSPPGGAVTITISPPEPFVAASEGGVLVAVTDAGPGVPAAYRTRVFEKFFRLEHQLGEGRSGARGAGIGLYMCQQIIELHGGHIGCTAGPHDTGARFFFELPRAPSAVSPAETVEATSRA